MQAQQAEAALQLGKEQEACKHVEGELAALRGKLVHVSCLQKFPSWAGCTADATVLASSNAHFTPLNMCW